MNFYEERVLPRLISRTMRYGRLRPYRERTIARARGRVLEIGVGSGLNLPLYGTAVSEIVGLEPAASMMRMAQEVADRATARVTFISASAEALPLDTASIDTIVTTWTLCSIPDIEGALREARRVLRHEGQLLFVEHGLAPEANVRSWQNRLTPFWERIAGGCHLNRPIALLLEGAGFAVPWLETGYMKGPKLISFMYEGIAHPR